MLTFLQPAAATETPVAVESATVELTEEQKKLNARRNRFGIPTPSAKPAAAAATPAAAAPASKPAEAEAKPKKEKASAIDRSAAVTVSDEVLARRRAKFGPVEKKEPAAPAAAAAPAAPAAAAKPAPAPAAEAPKAVELTP